MTTYVLTRVGYSLFVLWGALTIVFIAIRIVPGDPASLMVGAGGTAEDVAALDRKPGALDHAPVFRDWKLPACFAEMRAELERVHGGMSGSRRFVRVLQLLGEHPMSRVAQAIEACLRDHLPSAEAVIQRTQTSAANEATKRQAATPCDEPAAARVDVPLPDLSRFDQFLCNPAADRPSSVIFA